MVEREASASIFNEVSTNYLAVSIPMMTLCNANYRIVILKWFLMSEFEHLLLSCLFVADAFEHSTIKSGQTSFLLMAWRRSSQ